jgi:hypothetical protein
MEYTDFMLWKLIGFAAVAFVWGIVCGYMGWPLSGPSTEPTEGQSGTGSAETLGSESHR